MKIRKPIYSFLLVIVLTAAFAAGIAALSIKMYNDRDRKRNEIKIERIQQMLDSLEKDFSDEYNRYLDKIQSGTKLTALMLPEYIVDGKYTGPMVLDEGFVVQIKDGTIYYPDEEDSYPELDLNMFSDDPKIVQFDMENDEGEVEPYIVSTAKIKDSFFYVDFTPVKEITEAVYAVVRLVETIDDIEKSYGCRLLVMTSFEKKGTVAASGKAPDFYILPVEAAPSEEYPDGISAEEMGVTADILSERPRTLTYAGTRYASTFRDMTIMGYRSTIIILNNLEDNVYHTINKTVFFVSLVLISAVSVALWIYWVQVNVRDNELSHAQVRRYCPEAIYKRVASVILVGGIGIFLLAIFYQTLNNLNSESLANQDGVKAILQRLDNDPNNITARQDTEEKWNVFFIKRVASLMESNPNLRTKEYLEDINTLLQNEYMMLFDKNGNEYASSNTVIGYSLTNTEFLQKYSDLLNGLDTIVGDPIVDDNSGKTLQIIGTPIHKSEDETCDVLILAADVENTWRRGDEQSIRAYIENTTPEGSLCIVIDKDKGTVVYSSEPAYIDVSLPGIGYTAGSPDSSDLDTYLVDSIRYYGSYDSNDKYVVYYMTEESYVRGSTIPFAAAVGLGYAVVIFLVSWFMLSSYNEENFKSTVRIHESTHNSELDSFKSFFARDDFDQKVNLADRWKSLNPDNKIKIFLHGFLVFMLLLAVVIMLWARNSSNLFSGSISTRSTIFFILYGNWKRGFNLLGLAGVLLVILSFVLFILFKNIMIGVLCTILDPKGETICRLTFSLLQYGVVIGGIYLMMGFLGFNTTFQLTSVGIVSLAISLGSQDIVADILAGIFIIFEGDFQVGDIVNIDGFTGIVQEIGVRSTKVLGLGDNIKIIGNKSVKNVVNMSKMNTWLTLEYKLPPDVPLLEVEKLLEEKLPEIGRQIPEIISGPFYKGVWAVNDWGKKIIHVSCECTELNSRVVTRKLNREIIVLLEGSGYKIG